MVRGGTAGAKTINIAGAGAVNLNRAISAGGGASINMVNIGTSVTTLTGGAAMSLNTLRAHRIGELADH